MFFLQPSMQTSLSSNFDERQWVKQIRQTLDEELEEETETPVTIHGVPKALMMTDPDSYTPQQVAIGPYHHLRLELYDMERYKVAAAKRNQKELQNIKVQDLVDDLMKSDWRIRACYHRPLSFGCEALAWIMAIDVSFLYEFLQAYWVNEGGIQLSKIPSGLAQLIDLSGNNTIYNIILRDIMMLENQIPLFVMRMLLELKLSSPDLVDKVLLAMLIGVSEHLSPFKMAKCLQKVAVEECAHLLDFLYKFIVPCTEKYHVPSSGIHEIDVGEEGEGHRKEKKEKDDWFAKPSHLRQLLHVIWKILSSMKKGPIKLIKRIIFSKHIRVIVKLPWRVLTKIPIIKMFKEPIENLVSDFHEDKENKENEESSSKSTKIQSPPLQEEIAIPSVTQLFDAGVHFLPANGGIESIHFDDKTLTFYIPIIILDVNSEVVLRNLVAYEACSASGPLFLTRYTELMNGIIDTDVDANFLCQRGIIINHLKSEKEVADLWNGMSKSVRLTKVQSLDKVITDVNKFYNRRWKVKLEKFMKEYVFASWRILTFFAAIMMLLLMCLQAFCEVYSCSHIVPIKALEPPTDA